MDRDIPGYAQEVHSGWVWVIRSNGATTEYGWSHGRTREECFKKVEDAVSMHGINGTFYDDVIGEYFEPQQGVDSTVSSK